MSEPVSNDVLAERLAGYARAVDDALLRGTARMDRSDADHAKDLQSLRLEAKADNDSIRVAVAALSKDISELSRLKSQAQGWLAGLLFVVALFGGGVGALIKSILVSQGE